MLVTMAHRSCCRFIKNVIDLDKFLLAIARLLNCEVGVSLQPLVINKVQFQTYLKYNPSKVN